MGSNRVSDDNVASNPSRAENLQTLIERRAVLRGLAAAGAAPALAWSSAAAADGPSTLTFAELAHGIEDGPAVAEGYEAQTLIRWGDAVSAKAPAFDPAAQSAEAQEEQWGYSNDFIAFMPFPFGSEAADRGLLCVNFEYTVTHLMFPGHKRRDHSTVTRREADVEMAAHGHAVIEVMRDGDGKWSVVEGSRYNRRISARSTDCTISGPAAGHARLRTNGDPTGRRVRGTLNNCAGGITPWGTVLIAEENFQGYFSGDPQKLGGVEGRNHARYGIRPISWYSWHRFHDRFDIAKDPREPNKFGWMVEIDPYDPTWTPIKRTALGRFKHEGATCVVNRDGRLVVYSGDDQRFEYIYKFVSDGKFEPGRRTRNMELLDKGTLYVGRFDGIGLLHWLPLVWGQGPLTPENGFADQAEVLIETRRAADLLGATPMDRPEDVEPNPVTGTVFAALTKNKKRKADQVDQANPRGPNLAGHVIEMVPPTRGGVRDHAAERFNWEVFLLAGDPAKPGSGAVYHPATSANGWLATPDNVAFDRKGRLWIATDGAEEHGTADGLWATDVSGPGKALTRHFYRVPRGAELCGPCFTPDDTALFVAVQHPGDTKTSTFAQPATRWPDFKDGMPPRPAIQVIVKKGGGPIGG